MINLYSVFLIITFSYYTPIHSASTNGFLECVDILVKNRRAFINEISTVIILFSEYNFASLIANGVPFFLD